MRSSYLHTIKKMKHAGGRPKGSTKYKPILAEKLNAYVDGCYEQRRIPWIERFCYNNKISRRSFYYWVKQNEDLKAARDELMSLQELMLLQIGTSGQGNIRTIIFLLKKNHGYRETKPSLQKQETNVIFC